MFYFDLSTYANCEVVELEQIDLMKAEFFRQTVTIFFDACCDEGFNTLKK